MPTRTKLLIALICLAAAANFWLLPPSFSPKQEATPAQKKLSQTIDRCSGIADKSVAGKNVTVEFEKLAIEGIKAKVIQDCMNDNGFMQNPEWLKAARITAANNAKTQNISADQALTTLERQAMQNIDMTNQPLYWAAKP